MIDSAMIFSSTTRIKMACAFIAAFLVLHLLTSAHAAVQGNTLGLKASPLPKYRPGTTFVYSDGSWETAIKVGSEGITWRNHRGSISTGSQDFIKKRYKWQTKNRYGYREFKQTTFLMSPPTPSIWPLEMGNKTRFDENGRWFDEYGIEHRYDSFWICEVKGTERISVGAGDFDTWKITCRRYPDKFRSTSKTREYRTWYYAPIINHWVKEVRDYNGYRPNRMKELVAVLPDLQTFTPDETDIFSIKKQFQTISQTCDLALREKTRLIGCVVRVDRHLLAVDGRVLPVPLHQRIRPLLEEDPVVFRQGQGRFLMFQEGRLQPFKTVQCQ